MKITHLDLSKGNHRYFIEGATHEEVERAHWSFYNHEATGTRELNWVGDTCGSFLSTPDKMLRGMANIALAEILNTRSEQFKRKKGGALAEAKRIAQERFALIEEEIIEKEIRFNEHQYRAITPSSRKYDDLKDYIICKAYNC